MHEFKFTLSENDYIELITYQNLNDPLRKQLAAFTRFFPSTIFSLMFVLSLIRCLLENFMQPGSIVASAFFFIFAVGWFLAYKPFVTISVKWQIESMKRYGKLPFIKDNLIRFDEDVFVHTTPETESKAKYTIIERIGKGDSAVYIYVNQLNAYIIPLSVFESEQQLNDFWVFIHSKQNNAKLNKTK